MVSAAEASPWTMASIIPAASRQITGWGSISSFRMVSASP